MLHADARLGPAAVRAAEAVLTRPEVEAAAWPLAIDGAGRWLRWVERGAALRWRLTGLAYGDQGLLVRRAVYDAVGGYPDTRIMEDVVLVAAARAADARAPPPRADPRRRPALAAGGTGAGHAPERDAALAVSRRRGAGPARALVSARAAAPMTPALAVFLKAPRLGTVKTRLAAEIGERQALRLYRVLAHRTLAEVREAGLEATVWFTPTDAATEMRRWLGDGWDLRPQASGDLGMRLAAAAHAVPAGRGWLAIGADCPRLDAALLREAAAVVARDEIVLGPSRGWRLLSPGRAHAAAGSLQRDALEHEPRARGDARAAGAAREPPGTSSSPCATSTPRRTRAPRDS